MDEQDAIRHVADGADEDRWRHLLTTIGRERVQLAAALVGVPWHAGARTAIENRVAALDWVVELIGDATGIVVDEVVDRGCER